MLNPKKSIPKTLASCVAQIVDIMIKMYYGKIVHKEINSYKNNTIKKEY